MQDLGKEEEPQPTAPVQPTDVKQAWNVVVFFQRIFDVVIWQMKDDVKPEEEPEEEKAEGDEEARKTIYCSSSQDIFFVYMYWHSELYFVSSVKA